MARLNGWAGAALAVVIPAATYFGLPRVPALRTLAEPAATIGSRFPPSPISFERREIGPLASLYPIITNVQILDFDGDGRADLLACDARRQGVVLCRQDAAGDWSEELLAEDLSAPAHATVVDLDRDGDLDLVVSVLGDLHPNDGVIGQLIWLEQTGAGFRRHVLLHDVRRVADCQAADLDGDGDIDLAVAVFGYARGQVLWLENLGEQQFLDHELLSAARESIGFDRELAQATAERTAGRIAAAAERLERLTRREVRWQNRDLTFLQDAAAVQLELGNTTATRQLMEQQIVSNGFPTARAWELLAAVEFLERHSEQAWADWNRAERMQPDGIDHNKLARVAKVEGNAALNRRHLALAHQFAGIDMYRSNRIDSAAAELRQAVAVDPGLSDAWF